MPAEKPVTQPAEMTQQPELPAVAGLRSTLDVMKSKIVAYDPDASFGVPSLRVTDPQFAETIATVEDVPEDVLFDYATALKFEEDALAQYADRPPNYVRMTEQLGGLSLLNLRRLYTAGDPKANPLISMLQHEVRGGSQQLMLPDPPLNLLKKIYAVKTTPEILHINPDDPTLQALRHGLRTESVDVEKLFEADTRQREIHPRSQALRVWMRDALQLATDVTDPEQADSYIYANSKSQWGSHNLKFIVKRVNEYGADKLAAIKRFGDNSALASYSDAQLDRLYKLSQHDREEVERLKGHDVIAVFINMEGDGNGVSADVLERLDDDAARIIPSEFTKPGQIKQRCKQLDDLGIAPSTILFATHGKAGQLYMEERPPLDSEEAVAHVIATTDQELIDHITADMPQLNGYDVASADDLIDSIAHLMQPSRAIDDPDDDAARKKVISLSCQFDTPIQRASLGEEGEQIRGEETSLLRRLGEVLASRLPYEHIDLYGADISTNQQVKTTRGFYYGQNRNGRHRQPYPASVLHIDNGKTQWHRLNEVRLRK